MTIATTAAAPAPGKAFHYGLWTVQVALGFAFLMAGLMKSTQPIEEVHRHAPWATAVPDALVRFIGVSELAGGLGLLLPSLTQILPVLTPIAASGLVVVMTLGAAFHATRGEFGRIGISLMLGALAAFVAWGRFRAAAIVGR